MASILIVEDERLLAKDLAKNLSQIGYDIAGRAASASEALDILEQSGADLILMDVKLEGEVDGIETAARIRSRLDIPVVYLTGFAERDVLERAKKTDPYGYLSKPVSLVELRITIETALHKHRTDRRLRESEQRYREIVENGNEGIWMIDAHGSTTFCNRQAAGMLGTDVEDIIGKSFLEFIDEQERPLAKELLAMRSRGVAERHEFKFRRCDGEELWTIVSTVPNFDPSGNFTGALAFITDITERIKAEEALKESEHRFREMFRRHDAVMLLIDPENGCIVDANKAAEKFYGYDLSQLRLMTIQQINMLGPEEVGREREKAITEERNYFVFPHRMANGHVRTVEVHSSPIDFGGRRLLFSIIHDITQRKKAEQELRQSEERYRTVVDSFPKGALFLFDKDYRYSFSGGRGLAEVGLRPQDIIGRTVYDLFPPSICRAVEQHCGPVFEGFSAMYLVEYEGRVYENYAVPVFREDGGVLEGLVITIEITDRKRAEDALRESEERYRQLVEHANEAIFVVQDGRFKFVNPRSSTLSGYTQDELLGMSFTDLIHEEDLERPLTMHRKRLNGDETPQSYAFRIVDKEGTIKWVNLNSVGIRWEGRPSGLCFLSDITEIKKAEELALVSEKLKAVGEPASGVAHNFNNVLQIVLGGSQLAITDLELGYVRRARDKLEQIVDSARFGAETVKRLQDFARVRRDDLVDCHVKVFDLAGTVDEAVEMSKPWWKTKPERDGLTISLNRYVRTGCHITGNENELFEVIVNLIKNAAEALPQGGEIRVRTSVEDDSVILTVEDSGAGIAQENIGRIFEPFWTTKGFQGTGMGLAGSYGIVQRHGGEISVASEPGNGTSFTIRLPLSVEQPEPDERPMHRPVSFRLNILVVDDMLAVVKHLHTGLTSYGQTVHSASSAPAALDIFRETPVDVVICDLAMPEMNGWQVGEELMNICAERGMDKPVFIMLTGWGGQIAKEEKIQRSGVDRILEKPLDIDELVHVIEGLIGERTASGG